MIRILAVDNIGGCDVFSLIVFGLVGLLIVEHDDVEIVFAHGFR